MAGDCSQANEELLQLNSASLYFSRLSARVDFCVGWARWKQDRPGEARTLIQNAIDTGGKYVDPAELNEWQQTLKKVK